MAQVLRPIGHEDRLSIVDHLDELRTRLIICGSVLIVAFGFCFWQNHALLHILNRALPTSSSVAGQHGLAAVPTQAVKERQAFSKAAAAAAALAASSGVSAADQQHYAQLSQAMNEAAKALPSTAPQQEKPITIGVGEPFMTTLTVCAYFALLFALPVLMYQAYAFVIPALNQGERKIAFPLVLSAPALFIVGVLFAFLVVLKPAVHFLQGYNSEQFNILVQAKTFYQFEILTMLGIGLAFQMPLVLLGLHRLGVINGSTLTTHWRYATVIIAVIAAAMPGADPVTTGLEMLPLIVLFLASIVMLKFADRRAAARANAELSQMNDGLDPT
jgi:sec-independent protein translocase protein TatC